MLSTKKLLAIILVAAMLFAQFTFSINAADKAEQTAEISQELLFPDSAVATSQLNSCTFTLNDLYFAQSSYFYNQSIAKFAMGLMIMGAFPDKNKLEDTTKKFENFGFSNVQYFNYDVDTNSTKTDDVNKAAFVLASKKVQLVSGTSDLIVVSIRSGSYGSEWIGNFTVSPMKDNAIHYGFYTAADKIYTELMKYIGTRTDAKILITGFSRGAAVSNVLGKLLDDNKTLTNENIFTYTFATPTTVIYNDTVKDDAKYDNIFNIVSPRDIVTYLPFPNWGFQRFGTDLILPSSANNKYTAFSEALIDKQNKITHNKNPEFVNKHKEPYIGNGIGLLMTQFTNVNVLPDVSSYEKTMQSNIIAKLETSYASGEGFKITDFLSFFGDKMLTIGLGIISSAPNDKLLMEKYIGAPISSLITPDPSIVLFPFVGIGHCFETYLSWLYAIPVTELFPDVKPAIDIKFDINNDQSVNIFDLLVLTQYLATKKIAKSCTQNDIDRADFNMNYVTDIEDLQILLKQILFFKN